MNMLVYLTYPLLIFILAAGGKRYGKGNWNEEFMSLHQSKCLQGVAAICVLLHHAGQRTCANWIPVSRIHGLDFFIPIGYFFVSFFLFCSGYGLYKSYYNKEDYLRGFFRKRVVPLILAFYTTGLIFFAARVIMGEKMNRMKVIAYLTGVILPNPHSWYMVTLPIFYLFYFVCFRYIHKDYLKILGVTICVFLYTILGTCNNHHDFWMGGEWWYNSAHLFWIGMLFAKNQEKITEKWKRHYGRYMALFLFMLLGGYVISQIAEGGFSYYGENNWALSRAEVVRNRWICVLAQMVPSAGFVFSVLLVNLKFKFGNWFMKFMGSITLEFYLLHGLFLEFFSYNFFDKARSIVRIKNVAFLIVLVWGLTAAASILLQKLLHLLNPGKNNLSN